MFLNVKTVILVNTPWSTAQAPCSVSSSLNRVEKLSEAGEKTCFNSSKGSRISEMAPASLDTHNRAFKLREALC